MLGPFCKILHNPHYHMLASIPSPLYFQRDTVHCAGTPPVPPSVASARPEWSGGLLNMRPLDAKSSMWARVAEMLTVMGETGILPQQWTFTRQHVAFHSIKSFKAWLFLPQFKEAVRIGQCWWEELKVTLWLTALSFITLMLILLLVGVLVNAAISSERNGSKKAVKTIMNNIDYSRKDQPLHLNKMLDLLVEINQTSTNVYMQCMPMPNMQCVYLTPVFLLHIFLI